MRAVGEQMESEFGLMTLNTVRPLDPITLPKEGGTDKLATRAWLDSAIMIYDENPSRRKGHRSITLSFDPHPPSSVYFHLLTPTLHKPTRLSVLLRPPLRSRIATATDIMSIQQRSKSAPQLSASLAFQNAGEDKPCKATVLCPLSDHTSDLEATRRTVRFV